MISTILPDCYAAIFAAIVIVAYVYHNGNDDDFKLP
jgi:hypothetical protein